MTNMVRVLSEARLAYPSRTPDPNPVFLVLVRVANLLAFYGVLLCVITCLILCCGVRCDFRIK